MHLGPAGGFEGEPTPAGDSRSPPRTSARPRPRWRWRSRGARDQRLGSARPASATALDDQARALFARDPLDQRRIGIEDDEAAGRVHERRVGEAQREVVRLAEQHDQIGAAEHLGEGAEPRVVDAARAFHADRGHARRGRRACAAARGPPSCTACGPARISGRAAPANAASAASAAASASGCASAASCGLAWPERTPCPRSSPRADRRAGSDARARAGPSWRCAPRGEVMAQRLRRASLSRRPWSPAAAMSAWRSSWKAPRPSSRVPACPDSSTSGESAASAVHSAATALAWPGPPVTRAMPHLPGQARPGVRHVHGRRLVAHVHQPRAGAESRIEERHDVIAGQREDRAQTRAIERARQDVRPPDLAGHVCLPGS